MRALFSSHSCIPSWDASCTNSAPAPNAVTELWDGSSWTEVNDLNTGRYHLAAAGISTAGLAFGGAITADSALTESWNGTNWTELADLNTARNGSAGLGTQAAAVCAAGSRTTPAALVSEKWAEASLVTRTFDDT